MIAPIKNAYTHNHRIVNSGGRITVRLLFFFYTGCFSLKGQSETSYSFEWSENDSVVFEYSPFNHEELNLFDFKMYKDTLFVYKIIFGDFDTLLRASSFERILCQKIIDKDTVDFVKEFICLFIIDKKENIILKDAEPVVDTDETIVQIQAYTKGVNTYKEEIIMYYEREYNPKFLELCDLFFNIAVQETENDKKR